MAAKRYGFIPDMLACIYETRTLFSVYVVYGCFCLLLKT